MAEVLLGADGAILCLEREDAAEKEEEQETDIQNHDQRGAVQPVVIADGEIEVDERPDEGQHNHPEENTVKQGDETGVILIVLRGQADLPSGMAAPAL
ncbi:MAG: hypothetical protein IT166_22540 [Bryobacterales bacterium]|nr:hypothetical protein [Bryobacterales bacterium]